MESASEWMLKQVQHDARFAGFSWTPVMLHSFQHPLSHGRAGADSAGRSDFLPSASARTRSCACRPLMISRGRATMRRRSRSPDWKWRH